MSHHARLPRGRDARAAAARRGGRVRTGREVAPGKLQRFCADVEQDYLEVRGTNDRALTVHAALRCPECDGGLKAEHREYAGARDGADSGSGEGQAAMAAAGLQEPNPPAERSPPLPAIDNARVTTLTAAARCRNDGERPARPRAGREPAASAPRNRRSAAMHARVQARAHTPVCASVHSPRVPPGDSPRGH
jgi:hypothetical protein